MMRSEIVKEELIDHRNRTSLGLPPLQKQKRGPISHLVSQQWTQAEHTIAPTSGQALANATSNTVPSLSYEDVGSDIQARPNQPRSKGREGAMSLEIGRITPITKLTAIALMTTCRGPIIWSQWTSILTEGMHIETKGTCPKGGGV